MLPSPREPRRVAHDLVATRFSDDGHRTILRWRGTYWTWTTNRWVEIEDQAMRKAVYG